MLNGEHISHLTCVGVCFSLACADMTDSFRPAASTRWTAAIKTPRALPSLSLSSFPPSLPSIPLHSPLHRTTPQSSFLARKETSLTSLL